MKKAIISVLISVLLVTGGLWVKNDYQRAKAWEQCEAYVEATYVGATECTPRFFTWVGFDYEGFSFWDYLLDRADTNWKTIPRANKSCPSNESDPFNGWPYIKVELTEGGFKVIDNPYDDPTGAPYIEIYIK